MPRPTIDTVSLLGQPLAPRGSPLISLLVYHRGEVQVVTLAEGDHRVIGRDPSAEVPIVDESLSRRHARFEVLEGEVWVEDLGSTNGTLLNGQPVTRGKVSVGDEVGLGALTVSVHVLQRDARQQGLDSHDRFHLALEDEVVRARAFGRPAALLMLRRLRDGRGLAPAAVALRALLRAVDRLALYSDELIEVLLPELDEAGARRTASALLASASAGDTLGCGLALFPASATSAEELQACCREAAGRASAEAPVQLAGAEKRSWEGPQPGRPGAPIMLSEAMRKLRELIEKLAPSVAPVLLLGETGTGKEVLARLIHDLGPRRERRMACVNCGAIPATLVESVLFGHERGAFTGATQASRGIFEEADGGTVLLDEVGELSASAQAALLRVLETKQIMRVGSSRELAVDVRVLAATHRDLEAMCGRGEFRWDLYYRLNVVSVTIPPLRERPEEIAPLAELFVRAANEANGRSVERIQPDAMRLLHAYPWPGNVRELRNAVERAVVIAQGGVISAEDLPQRVRQDGPPRRPAASAAPASEPVDFDESVRRYKQQLILDALRRAEWNRTEAARLLGLPLRTLAHKMRQLGIKRL